MKKPTQQARPRNLSAAQLADVHGGALNAYLNVKGQGSGTVKGITDDGT